MVYFKIKSTVVLSKLETSAKQVRTIFIKRTKGYRNRDNVTIHINVVTQLGRPCLAGANIHAMGLGGLVVLRCQAGPAIIKHWG